MRHYKFTIECASGQVKDFECDAINLREARRLLEDFKQAN